MIAVDVAANVTAAAAIGTLLLTAILAVGKALANRLDRIERAGTSLREDVFGAIDALKSDQAATRENVAYMAGRHNFDLPRKMSSLHGE